MGHLTSSSLAKVAEDFHLLHEQRYGHALEAELELVNIRLALHSSVPRPALTAQPCRQNEARFIKLYGVDEPVAVLPREALQPGERLKGPLLITELVSTTYIQSHWQVQLDPFGNLLLQRNDA